MSDAVRPDQVPPDRRQPLLARFPVTGPRAGEVLAAHDRAVDLGDEGYLDPATGAFVFTAQAHWDRGECCGSGCRHCPYEDGPRAGQPRPGTE